MELPSTLFTDLPNGKKLAEVYKFFRLHIVKAIYQSVVGGVAFFLTVNVTN